MIDELAERALMTGFPVADRPTTPAASVKLSKGSLPPGDARDGRPRHIIGMHADMRRR
jgi:hypothetical protein